VSDVAGLRPRAGRHYDILRGALECFTRLGYAETTVEDIRLASGASVGSIYHRFGSKEGIAAALYAEGTSDLNRALLHELRADRPAEEGVAALVGTYLDFVDRNPDLARYLLAHRELAPSTAAPTGDLEQADRALRRELEEWVSRADEGGPASRLAPELLLAVALGPAREFSARWLGGTTAVGLAEATRVLVRAARAALFAPGPSSTHR
jgi:AcrR family transcriptional regulator